MKDDLISRQAAIDALWRLQRALKIIDKSSGADIMIQGIQLALRKIERLPSAQLHGTCKTCIMGSICKFRAGLGDNGYCSQWKAEEGEQNG